MDKEIEPHLAPIFKAMRGDGREIVGAVPPHDAGAKAEVGKNFPACGQVIEKTPVFADS